jgi:DNA-binding transcriptional ArsR family regulator
LGRFDFKITLLFSHPLIAVPNLLLHSGVVGGNMSKVLKTKMEILQLLSVKSKTLTDISRALELAPSTVSQHLKELSMIGAVKLADEQHTRKWKYYELVRSFNFDSFGQNNIANIRLQVPPIQISRY